MTIECGNCGAFIEGVMFVCPKCNRINKQVVRPNTIDDFINACYVNRFDYRKHRFMINENCSEPECFGIYMDGDKFIVYKNKSNGERSVRYDGYDEYMAVGIIFDKLMNEMEKRYPARRLSAVTSETPKSDKSLVASDKSLLRLAICVAVLAIFLPICAIFFGTHIAPSIDVSISDVVHDTESYYDCNPYSYYVYDDTYYFYNGYYWYYFDPYYNNWYTYDMPYDDVWMYDSVPYSDFYYEYGDKGYSNYDYDYYYDDYDYSNSYDYSYDYNDYDYSDGYDYNYSDSYNYDDYDYDYDYDDWGDWDSGDTDWDSDW